MNSKILLFSTDSSEKLILLISAFICDRSFMVVSFKMTQFGVSFCTYELIKCLLFELKPFLSIVFKTFTSVSTILSLFFILPLTPYKMYYEFKYFKVHSIYLPAV